MINGKLMVIPALRGGRENEIALVDVHEGEALVALRQQLGTRKLERVELGDALVRGLMMTLDEDALFTLEPHFNVRAMAISRAAGKRLAEFRTGTAVLTKVNTLGEEVGLNVADRLVVKNILKDWVPEVERWMKKRVGAGERA